MPCGLSLPEYTLATGPSGDPLDDGMQRLLLAAFVPLARLESDWKSTECTRNVRLSKRSDRRSMVGDEIGA
ncbi:hypothetical protein MES5069_460003 [Mesorhizobium escarrei]|uniref:Uncharacterized protein n=1 Tax=Mesorhizobium escarrei TaxID=666018 RepID=A0ABM9E7R4_9HYPH|nr:hypothetical protein MES5069_460003 [Mesorhizobium escarrei]